MSALVWFLAGFAVGVALAAVVVWLFKLGTEAVLARTLNL